LEYELNHGSYQESTKLEWRQFRELFEGEYLPGLRPRTQERYISVMDIFERIIKPEKLGAVTERTISLFVKGHAGHAQMSVAILRGHGGIQHEPQCQEQHTTQNDRMANRPSCAPVVPVEIFPENGLTGHGRPAGNPVKIENRWPFANGMSRLDIPLG